MTNSPIHSSQFYIYSLLSVVLSVEAEDMTEVVPRTSLAELWSVDKNKTLRCVIVLILNLPFWNVVCKIMLVSRLVLITDSRKFHVNILEKKSRRLSAWYLRALGYFSIDVNHDSNEKEN